MEESLQKMTVQRADKAFFFTKDNCIDKTYELEKGIKMFPSIFIEGAAASGKTVAVKMFLEKQKDINFALFFMDKERDDGTFIRKLSQIRKRIGYGQAVQNVKDILLKNLSDLEKEQSIGENRHDEILYIQQFLDELKNDKVCGVRQVENIK